MTNKRRISDFLPEVLQTDILTKFFAASGDHLFQPGNVEYMNGYVGEKPGYALQSDVYVQEPNRTRAAYQASAITVSRDSETSDVTHVLFYEDLINKLRFQGALVDDHNRLFAAEYYSFGLPVDLDKWLNFINYVWLPEGPNRITLLGATDKTQMESGAQFTYQGTYQLQSDEGTNTTTTGELKLSTGMKIRLSQDIDPNIRTIDYLVEGVGQKIRLVPDNFLSYLAWENPIEWDRANWDGSSESVTPTYVTIARGSANGNPWSTGNRWFHRDVALQSGTPDIELQGRRAQRPILEFDCNIRMWNMGTRSRGIINVVDSCARSLNEIQGKASYTVFENCDGTGVGVPLDDDMVVLFTNLRDPLDPNKLDENLNNRFYRVANLRAAKSIVLEVIANGTDTTGAPQEGDCVFVLQGDTGKPDIRNSNINSSWWYTQGSWRKGQSRQVSNYVTPTQQDLATLNQSPRFELFDTRGNSLADPAVYPNSNFSGCTLLQYKTRADGQGDSSYLGFVPDYTDVTPTNYLFEVTQQTDQYTWLSGAVSTPIQGMRFYKTLDPATGTSVLLNNWYNASELSRQYVVNEYWGDAATTQYKVDQAPDTSVSAPPAITVEVAGKIQTLDTDYTVSGTTVTLATAAPQGSLVKIRTYGGLHNTVKDGYFEIPLNLRANPNNEPITQFSRSDLVAHVRSVLENQAGFVGDAVGSNNWRDTPRDQSLGTVILQHRAPLLKLMGLNAPSESNVFENSASVVDPYVAIQWAQSEYLRFYNKVINSLVNLYNQQSFTAVQTPEQWLSQALKQVNVGKTARNAWANSGFDLTSGAYCSQESTSPTWVPPSATRLGVTPAYVPLAFFDKSQPGEPLSLLCHNGAVVVLKDLAGNSLGTITGGTSTTDVTSLTHPVAKAWLLFEQRMFLSLPSKYADPDVAPAVDPRTIFSAKYRRTSYTRADQISLLSPAFQKWCAFNQVDAFRNTTFDLTDPYTWNYGNCLDLDGEPVPGHWRGIYFYFYDTDQPHITPWRMLGFSQKPSWWDVEYGAAPYTSGNLAMWRDIEQGRIRQGSRAGVHVLWARPGITRCIPVDSAGELLPPNLSGVLSTLPSAVEAAADWKFGDRSPLENVCLTSVDSDFVWATAAYQTRPAQFIEYLWDGTRQEHILADQRYNQWINSDVQDRKSSSQFYVHRENPQDVISLTPGDATYYGSCGIQHWISEKLVSESLGVTRYLGNLIRGLQPNVGHKMAGFVSGDSVRLLVDSFGLGQSNSLLLPQEDVSVELLRTPSIKETFYTGVIVEYLGSQVGWRVIGYDAVDPNFTIIPSNTKGARNTVVVGNQRVVEYKQGLGTTQQVAYGTVMKTRQEVYDFLVSLGRHQESQGWVFDQFDETTGKIRDWSLSAREFLFWSQGPWAAGTYIALSPLATLVKYKTDFGLIQNVGQLVNGAYSTLDRSGVSISISNLDFLRIDDQISVRPLNDQGLFGVRLFVTSMEHALVFRNRTIFGDIIYDPVLNERQSRFRVLGFRSTNWTGRMDAPGYMVTQSITTVGDRPIINNQIIPNFEKSVDDLRKLFEVDPATAYETTTNPEPQYSSISQSVGGKSSALAKHLIGYQNRAYLTDLLVDNNVAFQFYQGMIKQKGTSDAIYKLLRNTNVLDLDQTLQVFEEYAFREGVFGADKQLFGIDVRLVQSQVSSDPQQVEFTVSATSDDPQDQKIVILPKDIRRVNQTATTPAFRVRSHYGPAHEDLPTAGYVVLDEVDHTVVDKAQLQSLYKTLQNEYLTNDDAQQLQLNSRVWQMIDSIRGWNVYKVIKPSWTISYTEPSDLDPFTTVVYTSAAHNLQAGDLVIIFGVVNSGASIDDTFVVNTPTATSFEIDLRTTNIGNGGTIWIYKSVRYSSTQERDLPQNQGVITYRELAYVDGSATTPWVVYRRGSTTWIPYRTEQYKVDAQYLLGSRLYDYKRKNTRAILTLWDPVKNCLPGIFSREISFKTPYDPAQYTADPDGIYGTNPGDAWGNDQVGMVWWDLSTTRFMDYEIGTDSYRRQHWGSIAPGTTVDIYEWVRSTVPPASWQNLVAAGTDLSAIGSTNPPSGQVKSPTAPYVLRKQKNSLGELVDVYYFWVRNTTTVPDVPGRNVSTSVLTDILSNPNNSNISWFSAMDSRSVLVGNVGNYLDGENTILQVNWTDSLELSNQHKQWGLIRPLDPQSSPTEQLWSKMADSLVEYNHVGDSVPNLRLPELQKYGLLIRPSQTLFADASGAREAFITSINSLIDSADTAPVQDPSRSGWLSYFTSGEPEPVARNVLAPVDLATVPPITVVNTNTEDFTNVITGTALGNLAILSTSWVVTGPGITLTAAISNFTAVGDQITINLAQSLRLVEGATYELREFVGYYREAVGGASAEIVGMTSLVIDGQLAVPTQRILVKDQTNPAHNGVYVVGTDNTLARASDFRSSDQDLYNAEVSVRAGTINANTKWYQSNQNIFELGYDAQTWVQGVPPARWVRRVADLTARNALDYQLNFGSHVLVAANAETRNRWTIWRWDRVSGTQGTWTLTQIQGYLTNECWSYTDWYAAGYDQFTITQYTFDTLFDRDQFLDFVAGDIVKVLNTGNGNWALYQRTSDNWITVGIENGSIQLSDRLYDYEKNQMGFDGGAFDNESQGYEYDTRLELEQIIQGLWNPTTASGFLVQDTEQNQPNQLFFTMVNRSLVENTFLDWVFKTSFINLRGFSEQLEATPYYTTNKTQSLVDYVNEIKPYHVKIRQFVDSRRAQDQFNSSSTDFDKPPYVDPAVGPRILDPNNIGDQVLLNSLQQYDAWYQNYNTNPDLIRKIRTRMIFDRVACNTLVYYAPGYDENTTINSTVSDLSSLYALPSGVSIPVGYVVKVLEDGFGTWSWYVRNTEPYSAALAALCWDRVAFQHMQGAVDRIASDYQPLPGMTPLDSPLLISGCAGNLTTLDGSQFSTEDAWDQTVWDNIRGWSYTGTGIDLYDQNITGGSAPRYITFTGDGTSTGFSLPWAPQDPNRLKIWVSGAIQMITTDWSITNNLGSALIAVKGLGYAINNVLTLAGGVYTVPATVKVTGVDLVGGITSLTLINPGEYTIVPDQPVALVGGTGVGASVSCRWSGRNIEFIQAPARSNRGANIWIVENGSTFNPAVSSVLDVAFDGGGLNRAHLEPNHPEELEQVWTRDGLIMDVYTVPSAGWGSVMTRTYKTDGITDQFEIGQTILSNSQLWVYLDGVLLEYGTDYMVNTEYMRVVMLSAPATGVLSVISVGAGGASKSLGDWSVLDPGSDYVLGDYVRLTGGIPTVTLPLVQITAVSAVSASVVNGGANYQTGDTLIYRYGSARESLVLEVASVTSTQGTRGIVTQVRIVNPGYYTSLGGGVHEWATDGVGNGVQIDVSWGIAQVFPADRGLFFQEPLQLTQASLIAQPGSPGTGSGLVLRMAPGAIREVAKLVGDGVKNSITLSEPAYLSTLLVTLNGQVTFDYNFDSEDPRIIGLTFVPALDDVVYVAVYNSSLYSLNARESFEIQAGVYSYDLTNPPNYSPAQSKNVMVYKNGQKLTPPDFFQTVGDGVAQTFAMGFTPSNVNDVTVWIDVTQLDSSSYSIVGNQITFVTAPTLNAQIIVQNADVAAQSFDYVVSVDTVTFGTWSVVAGDQIDVIVFTEDSNTSFVSDKFVGSTNPVYQLSATPASWGSVQVFVNGSLMNQTWDYTLRINGTATEVVFPSSVVHTPATVVEAYYPVRAPAQPGVGMRMFRNIYQDVQYLRLADAHSTRLAEPVMLDSTAIFVEDGRTLVDATPEQPGAVWIGSERIEYGGKTVDATDALPNRARLVNLRRGTLGTPNGVEDTYQQETYNGDGGTSLFQVPWDLPLGSLAPLVVLVNGEEQLEGIESNPEANFEVAIDPPSRVPGVYVRFFAERVIDGETVASSVPPTGSNNVIVLQKRESASMINVCHPAGKLVRDASARQIIPGGYIWPSGNQGIQYGSEPQTQFLLAEPGTRTV